MKLKLFIAALVFLTSANLALAAAGKLAYINAQTVIEQSPQSKSASQILEKEFKQRELDLRAKAALIQELEANYQKDSAIMSSTQKKKSEDEIIQNKRQAQFDQKSLQDDLASRRSELLKELQRSISLVIRDYGKAQGYDFIFTDGVAFAAESVDITEDILKELSKKQ